MQSPSPPGNSEPVGRSDVRRNRAALLDAARELFATDPNVPMYEVARRAGVGQATLYRHFPDRGALVSAVAEKFIDGLEAFARGTEGRPDGFVTLLREFMSMTIRSGGMMSVLFAGGVDSQDQLQHLRVRLMQVFSASLDAAQAAGTVRADVTVADMLMISRMIRGGLEDPISTHVVALSERILSVLLNGVTPRRRPAARRAPKT